MAYYISPLEVSEMLDIGYRTVLRWIDDGRFGEVIKTPTKRYKLKWSNITHFCEVYAYPCPDKIPVPTNKVYRVAMMDVNSKEAKALLDA